MEINIESNDNLYIIKSFGTNGKELIKLGYSSRIEERLRAYRSHNPFFEVIDTFYREDAKEFELYIHSLVISEVGNEWYNVDKLGLLLNLVATTNFEEIKNIKEIKKNKKKPVVYNFHSFAKLIKKEETLEGKHKLLNGYKEMYPDYVETISKLLDSNLNIDYNYTRALKSLESSNSNDFKSKIFKDIIDKFKIGELYILSDIKDILSIIYLKHGISNKPKATYIQEVFEVKNITITINSKRNKGYKIIKIK